MKHFSESASQNDVDSFPLHLCDIFDDIDDVYWMHDKLFMSVLDKHAPVKTRTVNTQVPYTNSTLRKAINKETCGVENILETAMINISERNMLCGGIVW